jgi:choline-sulfatase
MTTKSEIRSATKSTAPETESKFEPDAPNSISSASAITRRRLLQIGAGAGVAAALINGPRALTTNAFAREPAAMPTAPNIIVLMTDQERHHMHWPSAWAQKHLPGLQRLKRHGLYFNRAYTAACQCSPSRALMMTGRFAPVNRVTRTFLWPGLVHQNRQPNIASLLGARLVTRWCGKANGT